jgi:arylformamidase
MPDFNLAKPIDLTLPLRHGMRGVAVEPLNVLARDGFNTSTLHLYSHAGTHMDAQTHFGAGPETIDQHRLERCMGKAWVVPLDGIQASALITVADLGSVAQSFRRGESLLLRTLWSRHVEDPKLYRDGLPRISEELAHWCAERGVKLLGVEQPSVADVNNREELTRIHRILLAGGVTIVEGLANLDLLTQPRVFFAAFPLPIVGCDGCPVRALAFDALPPEGMWT